MVPMRLMLRNFLCYRQLANGDALTLDLSGVHVVCLSGENGAGKSSLLDAITWALWGEARSSDDEMITQGESETMVDLVFALNNRQHRVIRRRSRGKTTRNGTTAAGKSTLDFQILSDDGNWRAHGQNTLRETQDEINRVLRMSYRTFVNASFLLQGRADEFTRSTPAERKQVLAEILELNAFQELEQRARERSRSLQLQQHSLRGQIEAVSQTARMVDYWRGQTAAAEERMQELRESHRHSTQLLEASAAQIQLLEELLAQRRELAGRAQEIRNRISSREADLAQLEQRMSGDQSVTVRAAEITAGMDTLRAVRSRLAELDQRREQYQRLENQRKDLRVQWADARNVFTGQVYQAQQQRDQLRAQVAEREQLTTAEERINGLLATFLDLEQQLPAAQLRNTAAEQALHERQQQRQRLQSLRDQQAQQRRLMSDRLTELQRRLSRLDQQLQVRTTLDDQFSAALTAAQALPAAEQTLEQARNAEQAQRDAISRLRSDLRVVIQEVQRLTTAESLLHSGSGPCPVCRRELDADAGDAAVQHYQAERSALDARRSSDEGALREHETQLPLLQQAVSHAEQQLLTLRGQAQTRERLAEQIAQLTEVAAEADLLRTELTVLEPQLHGARGVTPFDDELTALSTALEQGVDEAVLRRAYQDAVSTVARIEQQIGERAQREAELAEIRRRHSALAAAAVALPAAEAAAAELDRRLKAQDFAHEITEAGQAVGAALAELNFEQTEWDNVRAEEQSLAGWEAQQRTLELAQQRLAGDQQLADQVRQLLAHDTAAWQGLQAEIATRDSQLTVLPDLRRRLTEQQREVTQRAQALRGAELEHQEQTTYLRAAEAAAEQLAELQQIERDTAARKDLFAELAVAFGKSGVQAMLIETAIPQIEDEANALLGRLSDGQMHLTLDTQRDTKKGDSVETLEIRIADGLGTRSYDAFSGGEALRVNFALRIALSRLLAQRAGASLETLVIDEGFGVLDAVGRERMIEAISSVQDSFKRIIVITHIDELKERFPATIEVRKTAQGSRWELR